MLPDGGRLSGGTVRANWAREEIGTASLFGPQNPFDRTGFVIEANDKFSAGNDRVIRPIVSGGVVMEPISRRWIHELVGSSPPHHGRTNNFGQVPSLKKGTGQVHL
jgi:hypothetical protein